MKKVCLLIACLLMLSTLLSGCSQEPWVDMVDTLMQGDFKRANKQYERIEKNYVQLMNTSEYVYQYIENIVTSFKQDKATYETANKKLNLFSLLEMPLYNLETAKSEIDRIQASRAAFEEGRAMYLSESYYDAHFKFNLVETDDSKNYDKAQEYLLSIVYVLLYSEEYEKAADVILSVDINSSTLPKLSEYSIELAVRLLYYLDDIDRAHDINNELIKIIIQMDPGIKDSIKEWAGKLISVYSRPEYSAVCISFLSDDIEDMFYKLEQMDTRIEAKKTDYAFIILKSIAIRQDTIGYIAPRMTEILSQYISQGKPDYAQSVVDTIFSGMDNEQMVGSLVTYIQNNIENKEYLKKIDMTVGR
ncbi:MAG: hypothetical protein BWX97_01458 [Firmicutes bacterium ADurb.Bin146]|nr:MAG: hypothetical protein BWX97_01458 [Firmicutes bacterium ADurb.Bin146]